MIEVEIVTTVPSSLTPGSESAIQSCYAQGGKRLILIVAHTKGACLQV